MGGSVVTQLPAQVRGVFIFATDFDNVIKIITLPVSTANLFVQVRMQLS